MASLAIKSFEKKSKAIKELNNSPFFHLGFLMINDSRNARQINVNGMAKKLIVFDKIKNILNDLIQGRILPKYHQLQMISRQN
jgi:hypothetical protein